MVEVNKISANYKLIIIQSEQNLENKLIKEKKRILHIVNQARLPLCKNPLIAFKRLKKINDDIFKAKQKIIKSKANKLFGITDDFSSIALLSIFEKSGWPIELIENGPSTYEHDSINGNKGKNSLRIILLNLIFTFSKQFKNIKAVDYIYEILFKINNEKYAPRKLNTNFNIKCDKKEYIPKLIKKRVKSNLQINIIPNKKNIFFFNQPFYQLRLCRPKRYINFLEKLFGYFPENKIYFIPHPADDVKFLNLIKNLNYKNLIIEEKNNSISNEDFYLIKKDSIFMSINSSILMYTSTDKSSKKVFLNKLFISYFKNTENHYSFFNDFCKDNNFINLDKEDLKKLTGFKKN